MNGAHCRSCHLLPGDGLAARRRVITYENRGVGASGGSTPDTIEAIDRSHPIESFTQRTQSFCLPSQRT
ncbi:hypothetical protein EES45_33920 [Streptomyces sp. ADI97-07]|nr:hypothetical protein EES45_33920 [Streptomyces sp. ADI97-07]